jgi:hypothetical protein
MSNITLNAGTGGATLGTDTVAGTPNVDYQIVKIGFSASGASPVQVQTGNPLPTVQTGALPAGTNLIGGVKIIDTAGTNQAAVSAANALKVDGSAVTQPVSGTVTANAGSGTFTVSGTVTANAGTGSFTVAQATAANLNATVTGTVAATQSGSWSLAANQSTNIAQINGVPPLMGNGVTGTGSLRVTVASDNTAFSVNSVQSGTWTVQPGNTANTTPWLVTDTPATSGGLSFNYQIAPATPAKTAVKASAGQLFAIKAMNINATPVYVKLFNAASASVTLGTTACDDQFLIPGNTAGAGVVLNIDKGVAFGTAITAAITGAIASTDNTAISANTVVVTFYYK